jgi:hypothetical protein
MLIIHHSYTILEQPSLSRMSSAFYISNKGNTTNILKPQKDAMEFYTGRNVKDQELLICEYLSINLHFPVFWDKHTQ